MSSWTHNVCWDCWREQRGDARPAAIGNADVVICCWCGKANRDGIYQRADPDETPCKGKHGDADKLSRGRFLPVAGRRAASRAPGAAHPPLHR